MRPRQWRPQPRRPRQLRSIMMLLGQTCVRMTLLSKNWVTFLPRLFASPGRCKAKIERPLDLHASKSLHYTSVLMVPTGSWLRGLSRDRELSYRIGLVHGTKSLPGSRLSRDMDSLSGCYGSQDRISLPNTRVVKG
jgi:hypothetical protein